MSTAQGGPNIVTNGLVFYIDAINRNSYISGSTNVNDLTKNSSNGSLVNGVDFDGDAWTFDGANDHIRGNDSLSLIGTGDWSMNCWFKIDNFLGGNKGIFYIDLFTGLNINVSTQKLVLQTEGDNIASDTIIKSGVLYNAHCNFEQGSSYQIYLNGDLDNSDTTIDTTPTPGLDWLIGVAWVAGPVLDRYWDGDIPMVSLYNRVLSPQEVKQNYNALKGRFI